MVLASTAAHGEMLPLRALPVSFVVLGQCASLKNSRRLLKNRRTGKIFSAKSSTSGSFIDAFVAQVPAQYRNLSLGSAMAPLRLIVSVFYASHRSDLDVSAVMDGLQAAGVIANDRYLFEILAYKHVDPVNPRCEIIVEEL
jgi:Holliday junction resolvase RusA-like endonuclease